MSKLFWRYKHFVNPYVSYPALMIIVLHGIDDNSGAGNEFDDSSPEKSVPILAVVCNYHKCGFRNRSQEV